MKIKKKFILNKKENLENFLANVILFFASASNGFIANYIINENKPVKLETIYNSTSKERTGISNQTYEELKLSEIRIKKIIQLNNSKNKDESNFIKEEDVIHEYQKIQEIMEIVLKEKFAQAYNIEKSEIVFFNNTTDNCMEITQIGNMFFSEYDIKSSGLFDSEITNYWSNLLKVKEIIENYNTKNESINIKKQLEELSKLIEDIKKISSKEIKKVDPNSEFLEANTIRNKEIENWKEVRDPRDYIVIIEDRIQKDNSIQKNNDVVNPIISDAKIEEIISNIKPPTSREEQSVITGLSTSTEYSKNGDMYKIIINHDDSER